jgi:hypothetical protein
MRILLIVPAAVMLFALVGCGTSSSPRTGLSKITSDQQELAKLDDRAAKLPGPSSADLGAVDALATDTDALLARVRGEEPASSHGDERTVWKTFIQVLELRDRSIHAYADGIRNGDLTDFQTKLPSWNEQTRVLNNRFNASLAHMLGKTPPPPQ